MHCKFSFIVTAISVHVDPELTLSRSAATHTSLDPLPGCHLHLPCDVTINIHFHGNEISADILHREAVALAVTVLLRWVISIAAFYHRLNNFIHLVSFNGHHSPSRRSPSGFVGVNRLTISQLTRIYSFQDVYLLPPSPLPLVSIAVSSYQDRNHVATTRRHQSTNDAVLSFIHEATLLTEVQSVPTPPLRCCRTTSTPARILSKTC